MRSLLLITTVVGGACDPHHDALGPRELAYREIATIPVGEHPVAFALVDFDRDGDRDVLVPALVTPDLTILRNEGGSFTALPPIGLAGGALSIVAADFDGDGADEIAISMPPAAMVQVLSLRPDGSLVELESWPIQTGYLAVGDFDGDLHADLILSTWVTASASVLLGDGAGGFEVAGSFDTPHNLTTVCLDDLDRDGSTDLVMTGAEENELWVDLGGTVAVTPTGAWPLGLIPVQLDDDSALELVGSANLSDSLFVVDVVDGLALAVEEIPFIGQPSGVATGDLDQDGRADVVVAAKGGDRIDLLLGDGARGLGYAMTLATGSGPTPVGLEDLDGDGCLDIVVVNSFSNDVTIFACSDPGGSQR